MEAESKVNVYLKKNNMHKTKYQSLGYKIRRPVSTTVATENMHAD